MDDFETCREICMEEARYIIDSSICGRRLVLS